MPAPDVVWRPDSALITESNVGRFMRAEQIDDFATLVARSITEPEWFWDAVVRFLDLRFDTPYERVLDTSDGIAWARWFVGGRLNFAANCLRHPGDRPAIVWEGEDGAVRRWTYAELAAEA